MIEVRTNLFPVWMGRTELRGKQHTWRMFWGHLPCAPNDYFILLGNTWQCWRKF